MTELTRRSTLGGAAAVGAAAMTHLGATPAQPAEAPPRGTQAASFYRYKVGDYEITVVADGSSTSPLADNFVINQTRDDVNAALAAASLPTDEVTITYSPIVVNTGSHLIVMDTGTGEANLGRSNGAAGRFQNNLKASGIDRQAVDMVVISHFHRDHINGLLTADNSPAFPNAEILVPAAEWKYFMDDGEMSRAPAGRMQDIFNNTRRVFDALRRNVTPYEWDKDVAPGITAVATRGHSPGHTSFVIASGSGKLFVQGDVTNLPQLFARNPGWHPFFDQDPQMAEETRRRVYDMLAAEKMMVQGFHYPFPAVAYVEKAAGGYREHLVPWSPMPRMPAIA